MTELLACTMIMLLATSALTGTITLATKSYDRQIRTNKADILCESISYALREKLSYVYRYDSVKHQYYSTSSDLGYYPFTIELIDVQADNVRAHKELVLKYYSNASSFSTYHLVNSASYIGGDYTAEFEVDDNNSQGSGGLGGISSAYMSFDVTIRIKDTRSGDVLSETDFVVNPFITEVPDIN